MTRLIHKRINVTLPEDTIRLINRVAERGNRSRLLNEAIHHYVKEAGKANLWKLLKEGAIKHAGRDATLAHEWLALEHEVWQKGSKK